MAESITLTTEGTLLNWLKDVGDTVSAGDIVAEIEADKATVEIEAPADGVLIEQKAAVGDSLSEGDVIGAIGSGDEAPSGDNGESSEKQDKQESEAKSEKTESGDEDNKAAKKESTSSTTEDGRIMASPVARNIADERGIDIRQVKGTGPDGRIVKKDVLNFDPSSAPARDESEDEGEEAPAAPAPVNGQATYGAIPKEDVEVIDVQRMRQRIAQTTILSKQQIPHFYVTVEVDVEPLLALRKQINESLEAEGIKISVNDMIVKAAALTLRKFPNLNSHYYGDKLVRHKRINIGIAVALPDNGLMNVVARDADVVSLGALAESNKAMFERAREGRIKPDDLKGATFTVSNLGPYGVEEFSAIISPPEAGILAVSSARKVPVVLEDGSIGVGQRMKITISVDHRVSDGAEGAEYLQALRELLENPLRMLA